MKCCLSQILDGKALFPQHQGNFRPSR
jgi:hypothetical protein